MMECASSRLHCTMYNCTMYNCTMYNCTMYNCTMYIVHGIYKVYGREMFVKWISLFVNVIPCDDIAI